MNEEIKEQAEVPQENQAPAAEGAASVGPRSGTAGGRMLPRAGQWLRTERGL